MLDFKRYPCTVWDEQQWRQFMQEHRESISASLQNSIAQLQEKWESNRDTGLAYLVISYLRSSVTDRHPLFAISAYDKKLYKDLAVVETSWNPNEVAETLYSNVPMPSGRYRQINDPHDYEIEKLWFEQAEIIFSAMKTEISEIIKGAIEVTGLNYSKLKCSYGEYLDEQIEIFEGSV